MCVTGSHGPAKPLLNDPVAHGVHGWTPLYPDNPGKHTSVHDVEFVLALPVVLVLGGQDVQDVWLLSGMYVPYGHRVHELDALFALNDPATQSAQKLETLLACVFTCMYVSLSVCTCACI